MVELRTDVGRLYVCPRFWQRLYLRWTFRNFHSLPQQILNRRQKRMIENLSRSALCTPAERVPASAIIGVVENMRVLALPSTAEMAEAAETAKPAVGEARLAVLQGSVEDAVLESSVSAPAEPAPAERAVAPEIKVGPIHPGAGEIEAALEQVAIPSPQAQAAGGMRRGKRSPWALAVAGVSAAAVAALAFWMVPLWRSAQLNIVPAPMPPAPLSVESQPKIEAAAMQVAPAKHISAVPAAAKPSSASAPELAAAAGQHVANRTAAASAATPEPAVADSVALPQIVEAPRSGFIYPVAPNPNLVGRVVLKAVVGSDGTVRQVEVLSGDRALASAAVRAVRQWRYAPAQVGGTAAEAETRVTISFLGDDAVSIILPQTR